MTIFRTSSKRRTAVMAVLVLIGIPVAIFVPRIVFGATVTWDGGGADNNWSTCANWSADTCPTSADTVVFNGTSTKDSVVDSGFAGTVTAIQINSGYTGTITLARNLTVSGSGTIVTQASGGFDISGYILTLSGANGSLSLTGGTFTGNNATTTFTGNNAATSQTLTCSGTFPGIVDPGANASTFVLASGCAATLAKTISKAGSLTLHGDATAQASSTIAIGTNRSVTVDGSLAGLSGLATTTFTGNNAAYTQTLTCTGTWPGVVDPGSSSAAFVLAAGCSVTLAKTISKSGNVTLHGDATAQVGSTINLSTTGSLDVDGSLAGLSNLATTTFSGSSSPWIQTLTCTGTWPGVVDPGSGAADFVLASGCAATLAKTISKSGSITLHGDATAQAGSTISLSTTGSIDVDGSLAGLSGLTTTTFTGSSGAWTQTLTCAGSWPGAVSPGSSTAKFVLASGCTAALGANVSKSGSITVNGTLDALGYNISDSGGLTISGTGTLMLTGAQTLTAPTLNSGSTVNYEGSGSYSSLLAGNSYSNLTFSGSGSYALNAALTVSANLTISSGTLDASASACSSASCNITVGGNWSNSGTFTARTGTVTLNGTDQSVSGSTTFYDLTKTVSAAHTLTFAASATQTISHTLTLQGASGNLLSLVSSSPGTAWKIDPQGTRTIGYLSVTDSDNIDALAIDASDGTNTNVSGNTNWTFTAGGGGGSTPAPRTQIRGGHFQFFGVHIIIR